MAILISPSDNTGWGLGRHKIYGGLYGGFLGGAREYSEATPVLVRQYYRAKWGSKSRHGRRLGTTTRGRVTVRVNEEASTSTPTAPATVTTVAPPRRSARIRNLNLPEVRYHPTIKILKRRRSKRKKRSR
ncbi:pVII [Egyptian fruit bat adenovirus]|uniref:PVII n=1 Tax=Egyptian fruit bat adenovirus TaxID=2849732 RepID=A0A344X9U7_9ADEN|nr:pVII [Rousettus aegyptiacus adenovirus]AXE75629.1 pVII [Egyptian fruit bat adenovirus]